jgi:hypothetical protein
LRDIFFAPSDPARPRAGWRLFVYFGLTFVVVILIMTPIIMVDEAVPADLVGEDDDRLLSVFVFLLATLITTKWAARVLDRRSIEAYGLSFDRRWLRDYTFGLAAGTLQMFFIFGVLWSAGFIRVEDVRFNGTVAGALVVGLLIHLAVGFYEELSSRGYQLLNFEESLRWWNPRIAIVFAILASSVIFGFLHAGNPNASAISTINLVVAGVSLAVPVLLTRQLGISAGAHTSWNFVQGPVLGMAVSGVMPEAPVVAVVPTGPEFMTGGAFGPEAGIVSLVAEFLFVGGVILYVRRTRGDVKILPPPSSRDRLLESPRAEGDQHGGDDQQRGDRLPEIGEVRSADDDAPRDLDEVRRGEDVRDDA